MVLKCVSLSFEKVKNICSKSLLRNSRNSFPLARPFSTQQQQQGTTTPNNATSATETAQPLTTAQAASRAQALIDLLPGSTVLTKTAYATIGTGLGAFLITKGIYVPNDETLVLIAFALTIRTLYTKLSGPLSSYLESSITVSSATREIYSLISSYSTLNPN